MAFLWRRLTKSRWDSSDPERAPPPLPLNPQSPSVSPSRAGTSSAIQSAHAALTEKARESALVSHALAKRMSDFSPERSPRKDSASTNSHRRMQSLQPGGVRDLSLMLEPGRDSNSSTPRSPERSTRPSTPSKNRDPFVDPRSEEKNDRTVVSFPGPGPSLTPILRPTVRRPHHSILGENTPPQSATMLALQNMATPTSKPREALAAPAPKPRESEAPLSNVTNESTALVRAPQSIDNLSNQILSLTGIATALQKEMAQLSRRSRDNAADLMSLREATTSRDEDIRKSLRELITTSNDTGARPSTRDLHGAALLLDNKPHSASPLSKAVRPFSLPRIPSPNSFAASLDRDSTPSLCGPDTPATIALLEKILRDMGTKEGQDLLLTRLAEVIEQLGGMASAEKVEELWQFVRAGQGQSVVPAAGPGDGRGTGRPRNFSFEADSPLQIDYQRGSGPMTQRAERLLQDAESRRSSAPPSRAAEVVSEDILKIIRSVKDSVAQGGGLTAEVKALVRELRGEVLGMGREIGRRLDEAGNKKDEKPDAAAEAEMTKVVEEGIEEMKQHMNHLLREHRRQSAASAPPKAAVIDYQEVYSAVRAALKDSQAGKSRGQELSREDVLQAVQHAWEAYKPEIEVQQLGLERDEVLECLKEGLRDYAPRPERSTAGATREEVFKAVVEGLKHFVPPQVDTPATLSRDEILGAVRECLEEFEFPIAPSAVGAEISKDDMVDAVKQGLHGFDFPTSASALAPQQQQQQQQQQQPNNDEVVARLHEIMALMQDEFRGVSAEAKQNVAASGRDTEQLLDATKDGFERLRKDLERYVDRAAGANNNDEFMEALVRTLDVFREEIEDQLRKDTAASKDLLKEELESLRDTVNSSLVPMNVPAGQGAGDNRKVLEALHEGISGLRTEINNRPVAGTTEVLDALQEGLDELRASIEKLGNKPADLTANDEILDALKSGLNGVRTDIDGLRDQSRAVTTVENNAVIPAEILKHDDIKNLEVLITQLRIKVEAMEPSQPAPASAAKESIAEMEEMLRNVQESVAGMASREPAATDAAAKEDVQAIETILRNTKSRLDDLIDGDQAVRKEHIDNIETLILEAKENLDTLSSRVDGLSSREDIDMVERLVAQVATGFDDMRERHDKQLEDPARLTKAEMEGVEAACLEMRSLVEQIIKGDADGLPSKEEVKALEATVREVKDLLEAHAETNAKAFEERQAEVVGVGDRVSDVKEFLEEFQTSMKEKLSEGASCLESLEKILLTLGETVGSNATVGTDLKEIFDVMKSEFEESKAGVVGAKLDADEKFQQTTDALASKIDERVDELVAKYEEFQRADEERARLGEARDVEMEAAIVGSKAVADELKSLIDTLGSAVTDSLEKMEEASKTVFSRVEDLMAKTDERHSDGKAEHQLTRDQLKQTLHAVEGVQGHVVEYQPKILETIKDVLAIVGQHYEHSKSSATALQDKIEEAKPPEQPLLPPVEKYDDSVLNEKLDRLVDHSHEADKAFAQLETLDKIQHQVRQTASDISEFISTHAQRIADDHEDKEKALRETTATLERRKAEQAFAEATLASLREDEDRLRESVLGLRADHESLTRHKTRLTADVSSLETALRLRREELQHMEARAEGLERRILDGVMDHSRVLLMAKATKAGPAAATGRDAMSRKRVPSQKPSTGAPAPARDLNRPRAALQLAMASGTRSAAGAAAAAPATGVARRILSLSQMTSNVPAGGFKRSQSVRNAAGGGPLRKSSWGGSGGKGYGDLDGLRGAAAAAAGGGRHENKENSRPSLRESDEEPEDFHTPRGADEEGGEEEEGPLALLVDEAGALSLADGSEADGRSDAGTLRRSSRGTSVYTGVTGTETEASYSDDYDDDDEARSEWTESYVGSSLVSGEGGEVVLYGSHA